MTEIKPAIQQAAVKSTELNLEQRNLRRRNILLLILASVLIHGLGLLLFSKFQPDKFAGNEDAPGKPIDFVVLPPTGENKKPVEESAPAKSPEPKKTIQSEPAPTPAEPDIAPTPAQSVSPPPPTKELPEKPSEEVQKAPEVLSGSEQNQVTTAIPEPETAPAPEPKAVKPEPVATSLPPPKPTEPLPETAPKASPEPNPEPTTPTPPTNPAPETDNIPSDSAASLLGGDYKKTLAENGTDAFFSPEALEYQAVLDPEQLQALKGFDLEGYQKRLYEKVKRNWQPSFRQKYTTWLTFNIQKNGQISNLQVIESSGSSDFDQIAMEAVQNAAPLEALPADFSLEQLEFKYQFYLY